MKYIQTIYFLCEVKSNIWVPKQEKNCYRTIFKTKLSKDINILHTDK